MLQCVDERTGGPAIINKLEEFLQRAVEGFVVGFVLMTMAVGLMEAL